MTSAMITMRGLASKLGLGKLALYAWHRPQGLIRNSIRAGGPVQQVLTERGHQAMTAAALALPELRPPSGTYAMPVTFLSGARFWDQTVFCIASLQAHAERRIDPLIYDDGTLSGDVQDKIRRVIPWAEFVLKDEVRARLEAHLPASRYPSLRARRESYPHLRKLTDLHEPDRWSLVFDSDMLFFRQPTAVLDWMAAPSGIVYMQDSVRSYGYSDALMGELARGAVPDRMNVGLYGLHGADVDFDYLEHCCQEMLSREGTNYLQEQALTALLVSGQAAQELSVDDYVVLPDLAEGRSPTASLHHYVAQSKRSYFQHGWKIARSQIEGRL